VNLKEGALESCRGKKVGEKGLRRKKAGGAYVTTPLVVMYAPLRIGSRVGQT
jgi:hypothetical protein